MYCCNIYFLEIIMLISLTGTLTQIRMGTAYLTFPGMRLRTGPCAFLMPITIHMFYAFSTIDYYFGVFSLLFSWNEYSLGR